VLHVIFYLNFKLYAFVVYGLIKGEIEKLSGQFLGFPEAAHSVLRSVARFLAMDSAGQGHISRLPLSNIFPPGGRRRSLIFLFVRSPGLGDFGSRLGSSLHLVRSLELSVDFLLA
jgi:hypothetical protein